jgi:mannitol/fructose-specific phosphotransferase system IIA component (Ntr-type)
VKLSHLLAPEHVLLDIPARTREEVLVYVAQHLEREGTVRSAQDLVDLLLERERLGATLVGEETAIPHCKVPGLKNIVVIFVRTAEPIVFGPDEADRARLFFFVLSPREQPAAHLQVLANVARLLRSVTARRSFMEAAGAEELNVSLARLESAA